MINLNYFINLYIIANLKISLLHHQTQSILLHNNRSKICFTLCNIGQLSIKILRVKISLVNSIRALSSNDSTKEKYNSRYSVIYNTKHVFACRTWIFQKSEWNVTFSKAKMICFTRWILRLIHIYTYIFLRDNCPFETRRNSPFHVRSEALLSIRRWKILAILEIARRLDRWNSVW